MEQLAVRADRSSDNPFYMRQFWSVVHARLGGVKVDDLFVETMVEPSINAEPWADQRWERLFNDD